MRRYLLPVSVSLFFIAWSPFIGPLRDVIKRALGDAFTPVIGLGVGLTVLAAVGWGARHVRERRLQRVGVMSLAVLLFVGYAAVMRTGVPDVDAVERIHFVEYGLVATLFYRAMAGMPLRLVAPLTLLIGVLVGIGEEWLQWLVPTRVGDVRDVFLNLYALGCGLLFAVGLYPPQTPAGAPAGLAWRGMLRLAGVVVLSFAGFLHCAHLGYELTDPAIGRFRSFFTFDSWRRWAPSAPSAGGWTRRPLPSRSPSRITSSSRRPHTSSTATSPTSVASFVTRGSKTHCSSGTTRHCSTSARSATTTCIGGPRRHATTPNPTRLGPRTAPMSARCTRTVSS